MHFEQELEKRLLWLADMAKDPHGGVTRLLYSESWVATQKALKGWMEALGFSTYFDEVGNLFGRLAGESEQVVMTGSHVDTVRNGGCYDGQYGIVAGILALAALKERYGKPKYTLEVVSFAEEEGSRFPMTFWGSKSMLGVAPTAEAKALADTENLSFESAIKKAGFTFKADDKAARQDIKAFLEVHIEQGGVLEKEGLPIGIVQHIVGQRRFTITLTGEANHAGTTPMSYRKDALVAASAIVAQVSAMAAASGDPMVATVGRMEVVPNVSNVVPGKVVFTIDARHVDSAALVEFTLTLESMIDEICRLAGVKADVDMWMDAAPVPMDPAIVATIQKQCDAEKLPYKMMHSGAGHDSQIMAGKVPTGMLFVPSRKGISHSPDEYTAPKDLEYGLKALMTTLHSLAY